MRNRQLDRLHLVSFPGPEGSLPLPSGGLDSGLVDETRRKYITKLKDWSSSWPAETADVSCPYPLMITKRHQEEVKNLFTSLNLAIADIVERWWTDEEAQYPLRMPLEPEEEDLLRWIHSNPTLFRPWRERQGSMRPDFLIEFDEAGNEVFRICEINARFCWNGFMMAGFGQQSLSIFDLKPRGLEHAAKGEEILGGLSNLFDKTLPLHLLKGKEHGYDIHMFLEHAKRSLGIQTRLITPDKLRVFPDPSGKFGGKLYCVTESDAACTRVTESGEKLEEVHQLGLELHQQELNSLDPDVRRQVSLRCFNDMRTILLAHDKRMLGIVQEELGSLVSRKVITPEQAELLSRGITPTVLPGSRSLDRFIEDCKESEDLQNNYILKPIRGGKGAGILFGDELLHSDWMTKVESMRSPYIEPGQTLYVVQRKINQPYYDVLLGSKTQTDRCHLVGTFHTVNGEYLGLGIWRCSPRRLCAVSDGATWMCSVKRKEEV
ncbi:hypothetical protein N7478_008309 [Penicillium angulare]|uniref:uncharacterized protein n=1 Tax=Penicillium angulare TaxID=116970 RepID=UPI002540A2C9|nr:uncharacterized protein N7478_008309 [Penicillium angulare]KAJ5273184.1 hypothetical protein N7478_008309 [Penicillium angulare]